MAFPGTNLYADADGDGISNYDELGQNSNPNSTNSVFPEQYVVVYQSSKLGWVNNGLVDVGLNGWVKIYFAGLKTNTSLCVWVKECSTQEEFRVEWYDATLNDSVWLNEKREVITSASATAFSCPYLLIQDLGWHPDFTATLGGEYTNAIIKVEFDHDKVNTRNLTHAQDDFPYYDHCIALTWDGSQTVDLADYLTTESLVFTNYVDWYVNNTKQSSSTYSYDDEPGAYEIEALTVEVRCKDGSMVMDRLIVTVVPNSTVQSHNTWFTQWAANTAWLAELPAAYSALPAGNGNPEPVTCTNQYWEGVDVIESFYHPGAGFEMRSEETPNGHGHQACYTGGAGGGTLITSGVAAGSADSHHYSDIFTPSHRTEDVLPFVLAAQLDGNPVWVNDLFPMNLNRPMMYEGNHLQQYMQVRPPIPNNKPFLAPEACGP
jgi:hypothetical protein